MADKPDDDQYADEFLDETYETEEANQDNGESSDQWDDGNYSDDPDANQENDGLGNTNTEKKKKSSFSTIIIIAVAVIGCLGFLVLKFGGGSPTAHTEQPTEQAEITENPPSENLGGGESNTTAPPTATPTTPENVVDTTPDTQGFMMAPEKVENIVIKKPEPPPVEKPEVDTPATAEPPPIGFPEDSIAAPSGNVPDNKTNDSQATPDLTAGGTPPAEFPTVANILKPQPDVKEALSDTPPVSETAGELLVPPTESPTPIPVSATPVVDNPAQNPSGNMDDVKKSPEYVELAENLNTANQKIAQLEQKLADQAKMVISEPDDNSDEIAALQEKIADLQEKLQKKEVTADRPIAPVARTVARKVVPESNTSVKQVRWVLRSASPGKAILYNGGANETKTVHVGDRVATIGTITSIGKIAGKWVVQGTTGEISR